MPSYPAATVSAFIRPLLTPTVVDVFFCVVLAAAFAHPAGLQALLADGDTGWHIRTGEIVLATGAAPSADPFSFTRTAERWFAWEWGSDAIFALLWRWKGVAAVAAFCGVILAAAAAVLLAGLLRTGSGLAIALGISMAAVSASSIHYLARPHVFSILFYAVALTILKSNRRLWLLIPLTALWANLHPGFVAWIATLGMLAIVSARRYWMIAAGCSAAGLANPYGWNLYAHIVSYLNSGWIQEHVQEFQSPNIRSEGAVVYALLLLAAVSVAYRSERFDAALAFAWGFASLRSARHVPLFALVAAPVVARAAAGFWRSEADRRGPRSTVALLWDVSCDLGRTPRISLWPAAAVAILFATLPAVGFSDARFPVVAVEHNSTALAGSRVLTSDQWADYLIFRLSPRQRVFFDGRSDFYGPAIGSDYRTLLAAGPGWRQLVEAYRFELALLPHNWPLSAMLGSEPGWREVYHDRVAVLYARTRRGTT